MIRRLAALCVPLLVLLAAFSPVGAQTDFLTDLVACWNLDEESGTRLDFWNNDLDLTDNNTVGSTAGHAVTTAALFTRANSERLTYADPTPMQSDSDFTLYAWLRPDSFPNTYMAIVSKYEDATIREFSFGVTSNEKLVIGAADSSNTWVTIEHSTVITGPVWIMALAWYDSSDGHLYLSHNGGSGEVSAGTLSTLQTDNSDLWFGGRADNANFYLDGALGPVAFWKRVLTGAERTALWNGGAGYSCSDITGLQAGQTYAIQQVALPSGITGTIEYRMDAGQVGIMIGLLTIAVLVIFAILADRAKTTRASSK